MIIVLFAAIACVYLAVCIDENRKRWKKIRLKGDITTTREEQIIEAAEKATYQKPPQYSELVHKTRKVMSAYEVGFIDGCVWADQHPNWISVDDQLPPYNERVLVFYGVDMYIGIAMLEDVVGQQTFWNDGRKAVFHITHWMPLPSQPKKGGKR